MNLQHMKKVLLVTLDFYPSVGGVSYYWMKLAEQLTADRLVVVAPLLSTDTKELPVSYQIIRKKFLSSWMQPRWISLLMGLWSVLRKERPDVIVVGQILPVGTAVFLLSYVLHIPYIISCHGMDIIHQKSSRKRWLMKKIFGRACGTVGNSHYTSTAIQSFGVPSEKVSIVHPCPVRSPQEEKMILSDGQKSGHIILTVGRIVARKGHEYVIKSLSQVLKQIPDIQYVILGDGPYRHELEMLVTQLGLQEHVQFLGALSDAEVRDWYTQANVFIMTPVDLQGDVEGFGIVYLEANAFGLPVIAAESGGVGEAVLDGKTGLVVSQKDVSAISDAICSLLGSPSFAYTLGKQGKERIEREFQWKVQANGLVKAIEQYTL